MFKEDCILIGKLGKTNGNDGYILAHLNSNIPEFPENVQFLHIDYGAGELVPYPVEYISATQGSVRLKLGFIDSVERAAQIIGKDLYISISDITHNDGTVLSYNKIIGWTITNSNTEVIGKIKEVIERPGQDLIAIEHNKKEYFIPLHEDFILGIDEENKTMTMSLPEGLLEIND